MSLCISLPSKRLYNVSNNDNVIQTLVRVIFINIELTNLNRFFCARIQRKKLNQPMNVFQSYNEDITITLFMKFWIFIVNFEHTRHVNQDI